MIAGRQKLFGLHAQVKERAELALAWADWYGVPVTVTSGFRSWEEQTRLRRRFEGCVARGVFPSPGACQFPANRPGDSSHNHGLSWDSTTERQFQEWWNSLRAWVGFELLPGDEVHAQVPNWRSLVQ